jgi:hypothetical protein
VQRRERFPRPLGNPNGHFDLPTRHASSISALWAASVLGNHIRTLMAFDVGSCGVIQGVALFRAV